MLNVFDLFEIRALNLYSVFLRVKWFFDYLNIHTHTHICIHTIIKTLKVRIIIKLKIYRW